MKTFKTLFYSSFFLIFLFTYSANSQQLGKPFIEYFPPNEYNSEPQNWAIAQGKDGIIYVGNNSHVLEYDGVRWRKIITKGTGTIRSLAVDSLGTVYVGGQGDFGYLAPDSVGRLAYVSLLEQIPENKRDFNDIWQIQSIGQSVYFNASKYIFKWQNNKFKIWETETLYYPSFTFEDKYFVRHWGVGLMQMVNDSLVLIPRVEISSLTPIFTPCFLIRAVF